MLKIRPATVNDWASLYAWRNDPDTRAASTTTGEVALADHMKWLAAELRKDTPGLYVAYDAARDVVVGTGRLDVVNKSTREVSLTVDPAQRGHGYGVQIVAALALTLGADVTVLRAKVRTGNMASLRAFADNDYLPKSYTADGFVLLERAR